MAAVMAAKEAVQEAEEAVVVVAVEEAEVVVAVEEAVMTVEVAEAESKTEDEGTFIRKLLTFIMITIIKLFNVNHHIHYRRSPYSHAKYCTQEVYIAF